MTSNPEALKMYVEQVTTNNIGIELLKDSLVELYKLKKLCVSNSDRFREINGLIIKIELYIQDNTNESIGGLFDGE